MHAPPIRSDVAEELDDADIVEVKPLPRSGTYVAVPRGFAREEMPMLPPAFPEEAETGLSNVVSDLARISDPSCKPRLRNDESATLDESEAYVAALVRDGFSMQAIIETCPMSEESSVRILAKLVTDGVVTFGNRSPSATPRKA